MILGSTRGFCVLVHFRQRSVTDCRQRTSSLTSPDSKYSLVSSVKQWIIPLIYDNFNFLFIVSLSVWQHIVLKWSWFSLYVFSWNMCYRPFLDYVKIAAEQDLFFVETCAMWDDASFVSHQDLMPGMEDDEWTITSCEKHQNTLKVLQGTPSDAILVLRAIVRQTSTLKTLQVGCKNIFQLFKQVLRTKGRWPSYSSFAVQVVMSTRRSTDIEEGFPVRMVRLFSFISKIAVHKVWSCGPACHREKLCV